MSEANNARMPRVTELEYPADSSVLFERIRNLPWPVFLESGSSYLPAARYDIIAANPWARITSDGTRTTIESGSASTSSSIDPLAAVREQLGDIAKPINHLPFAGGALGYVSYDYGRRLERTGAEAVADINIPEVAIGLYDWAVVVDHLDRKCWLASHGRDPQTMAEWEALAARFCSPYDSSLNVARFCVTGAVASNLPRAEYEHAFHAVQEHIAAGDCYQINLTQRFSANANGDAWDAYRRLRAISPAPLRDSQRARELYLSVKDRAENVMIVDLLRNDFGRCCTPGSISVPRLLAVESFANVHHLVSTVEGKLRNNCDAIDLFAACFPGGSITGAPKIRSMQIIDALEPHRRSIYCGAIGYIGYDRKMDTNIAIRTLLMTADKVHAWAGGGIVADSRLEFEYQESLDKATAMLQVLSETSAAQSACR